MSEPADGKQRPAHLFKPGQSGNPAGRPKGSRNRLADAFLTDLLEDWGEHGKEAIARTREEKPAEYVKVVASILPKQVEIKEDLFDGLTDEQLASIIALADRGGPGSQEAGGEAGSQPTSELPAVH